MRRTRIAHHLMVFAVAALVLAGAAPAFAQGMLRGKVVDAQNQPVEGAKVTIEATGGMNRKYEVKTDRKGEYTQIGIQPGTYRVSAEKEKVGFQTADVRISVKGMATANFQLTPESAAARPLSKEELAKREALQATLDAGVAASNAGNHDEAIAKFSEALTMQPDCYGCQYNIGISYVQKKEYDKAEEALKKAITMRPTAPEPYSELANIYNSQKRFDEAAKMGAEAAKLMGASGEGGNADQLFNQGVIFWNAGKIAEAKQQFEAAIEAKPDLADAHYWVAMANLNEGKLPEAAQHFEEYLKYDPDGQYAGQVKGVLSQIKK